MLLDFQSLGGVLYLTGTDYLANLKGYLICSACSYPVQILAMVLAIQAETCCESTLDLSVFKQTTVILFPVSSNSPCM